MRKSTKLLSVLLAIVMLFSCMSVMASAVKVEYQEAQELEALQAYSPYGAVTRLTTEERLSILFDYLDMVLAQANIKMNPIDLSILGTLNIDLTSIDAALDTVDGVYEILHGTTAQFGLAIAGWMLGIIQDVNLDNWQTGLSRNDRGESHKAIIKNLLTILNDNAGLISNIVKSGSIDLGVISVDLSAVEQYISDIPGLIKSLITPLLERKDDTIAWASELATASSMDAILATFVQNLFTKPQSTTTVKATADGTLTSDHVLPTAGDELRYYYEAGISAGKPAYTAYVYDPATGVYAAEEPFVLKEEVEDSGVYVYAKANGETLKYYEPESYWLPSLAESGEAANIMNISTQNGVQMLYDMIPYVFNEMAPVVLNGSVKKAVAEWFGTKFTYVGEKGSDEVAALGSDAFFTQGQGDYLWEWSDYKVIGGTHYYRFEDSFYKGDTSGANKCMGMVNWDYKIPEGLLDKYIPNGADGAATSQAGYDTIFKSLNNFFGEVIGMVLSNDVVADIAWKTGDNTNLLENVKKAARVIVGYAPETIFGEEYANDAYYNLMMDTSSTDQEILCGIAAKLLEALMPQLILPSAESLEGQSLGAMLAMVIRELATQLIPTYNYDDLIFTDYNTKTLRTEDNSYWLDVCLTMGVDIGMAYLRNLADLGDDSEVGYAQLFPQTSYAYDGFDQTGWEDKVDWVIDWALSADYEWTWKMSRLVNCGETIDLANAQDPWVKLGKILSGLLPIDQVLNVDTSDASWLKTTLRKNFVEALLNLDLPAIVGSTNDDDGVLMIPTGSVLRTQALLPMVVGVVRELLNDVLATTTGNSELIASSFSTIDSILSKDGLASLVQTLLTNLPNAFNNGLLDPVMPILGFFVGWKTDTQEYQDPQFLLTDTATGSDYLVASNGQVDGTLTVTNASMGMLLKHGTAYDQPYNIYITGVTTSDPDLSVYAEDGNSALPADGTLIAPWANAKFRIKGAYTGDKSFHITVTYYFTSKAGGAIGGEQTLTLYGYMDDTAADENTQVAAYTDGLQVNNTAISKVDAVRVQREAFDRIIYASSLSAGVSARNLTYTNTSARDYAEWVYSAEGIDLPAFATANQSYVHGCNENEILKSQVIGWMDGDDAHKTNVLQPLTYVAGFDDSAYTSGMVVELGGLNVVWHNHKSGSWGGVGDGGDVRVDIRTDDLGAIYLVDTADLQAAVDSYIGMGLKASNYADADAEWAAMVSAIEAAYARTVQPYVMDTTEFYNRYNPEAQQALIDAMDEAYAALEEKRAGVSSVESLEAAVEAAEGETGVNYQDYRLFEYWDYEEARNTAWDIIAAYEEPVAPDNYIDGSALSEAEIDALIVAETNELIANAISATVKEPSKEDLAAYAEAVAAYVAPSYTELQMADATARVTYYRGFLDGVKVTSAEKQFLDKEIAAANEQGYLAENFSTDSWAAYTAALDYADEVSDDTGALQSEVFNAKYNLMITQNRLVAKADSAKDTGAYNKLNELISSAETIFTDTESWTVKEGVNAEEAYKQLIEALGYEYEDENRNTQNLYWDSAKAFVAADREVSAATTSAIAYQTEKLQAAIDNFEGAAKDPVLVGAESTTGYVDDANGYVYGVDIGAADVASYFAATNNGSVKVVANEQDVTNGTGAKVQLLKSNGELYKEYTLIIFGDVNGDGAVSASDYIDMIRFTQGNSMSEIAQVAGDVVDATDITAPSVTASDYIAVIRATQGIALPVNPYAAA